MTTASAPPPTTDITHTSAGQRLDALIAQVDRQPLVAVGAGIVIGYLLARLLQR